MTGRPESIVRELLTRHGWQVVARPVLGMASRYAKTVIATAPGRYVLRVIAGANATNAAGVSRTVTVRVV